jgi:hypothetical protein
MLGDHKQEIYYLQRAEGRHKEDMEDDRKIVQKELDRMLIKKQQEKTELEKNGAMIIILLISVLFCC